jgi:hypothetical protein
MTPDELVKKTCDVWAAAGVPILRVENRVDEPLAVECDLVADTGIKIDGKVVYDYLNMTLYHESTMVWCDFSHSTIIGESSDSVESLALSLRRILTIYQPHLVPATDKTWPKHWIEKKGGRVQNVAEFLS